MRGQYFSDCRVHALQAERPKLPKIETGGGVQQYFRWVGGTFACGKVWSGVRRSRSKCIFKNGILVGKNLAKGQRVSQAKGGRDSIHVSTGREAEYSPTYPYCRATV